MHRKETIDKMKKRPTQREKIFANDVTHKGLISKNIRTVHTTQHQKTKTKTKTKTHTHTPNNPIFKNGQKSK